IAKAKAGKLMEKPDAPAKPEDARQFDVFVDGSYYLVEVAEKGGTPRVISSRPAPSAPAPAPVAPAPVAPAPKPAPAASPAPAPAPVAGGESITAPMPGMLVKYEKPVGSKVKRGDTILVLEAMKMYNNIPSPVDGTISAAPLSAGSNVSKGDVLAVITAD
ncbi:MAG TPA: carboxylase, partial [Candidatus Cloacimonadota bacterium]|nr:carboxylase [Candidatus Cloacimonadota bacterium]